MVNSFNSSKAEGIPEEYTIPVLIDLRDEATFQEEFEISLPNDTVEGSVNIQVSLMGEFRPTKTPA